MRYLVAQPIVPSGNDAGRGVESMSKILEGIEGLTDIEKIKELDDRIRAYQDTIVKNVNKMQYVNWQ